MRWLRLSRARSKGSIVSIQACCWNVHTTSHDRLAVHVGSPFCEIWLTDWRELVRSLKVSKGSPLGE